MRPGRRGRPHLPCPPCPPIGRSGGQGAETRPGAVSGGSLQGETVRARRGRCAGLRSSSDCHPRARRCHGRPEPALRAPSGTEELGHRSTKGARSQDRCRQAVFGRGSHHSAKPVSSVWLRGISTVQPHWLCVPRICFNQSYREPKQRGRHCVAHLLGGVQPVRSCRVLQRSTPVLVPFLLRGQVRLPVVLHDSRAVERSSHAVSSRHTTTLSKASRGRGQHRERPQRAGSGRGSRNNPGRQSKRDPAPERQVKSPPSPCTDLPSNQLKGKVYPKFSKDFSADSPAEPSGVPLSSRQPASGSPSHTTSQPQPQAHGPATSSGSGSKLPHKPQARSQSRVPRTRTNSSNQPQAPSQQHPRPSITSLGPSQSAHGSPGSMQGPNTSFSQAPPIVHSPSGTTIPMQSSNKSPSGPGDSAPKAVKASTQHQKESPAQPPSSVLVPEQPVSCQFESPLEYSSETTTEVTCSWPRHCPWLQYLEHCWRLKYLAC